MYIEVQLVYKYIMEAYYKVSTIRHIQERDLILIIGSYIFV